MLAEIFPSRRLRLGEPAPNRRTNAYVREHEEIFASMRRLFGMVGEIATATRNF